MRQVHKRAKIVATMGPASAPKEILTSMINAGLNVCRLNFSHGSHEDHLKVINTIREIRNENKVHVGILADLQGPKIRIGKVQDGGINLVSGSKIDILTNEEFLGNDKEVYLSYETFAKDVKEGEIILLDDGKYQLRVLSTNKVDRVSCEVVHGGLLTSRKGVNLPNTKISLPSLTDEDLINLHFALDQDVEWIALSFVRTAEDVYALKRIIAERGKSARVIAKIEKPEAIDNIDGIIAATDAVMVARGDLGVECPMETVPLLQKMIIKKCRALSKPVIVATQMLESMITAPRATRAEVNDVANSILDGADAVMLSAESSVGQFPVGSIETMSKIISYIESTEYPYFADKGVNADSETKMADAVCSSAVNLSEATNAECIVARTASGYTAYEIASHRPKAKTYVFSQNLTLLNTLSVVWGVRGFYYENLEGEDHTAAVTKILKAQNLLLEGDVVVNTASIPIEARGKTNMIHVSVVE